MRSEPTTQIARDLDRDYAAVLVFIPEIFDLAGSLVATEFDVVDKETLTIDDESLR